MRSSNDLPISWIERIFMRLHGRFGNQFLDKFRTGELNAEGNDIGIENAKIVWSEELAGLTAERISVALETKYDYPPSCDEFRKACVSKPAMYQEQITLPRPEMSADDIERNLNRMRELKPNIEPKEPNKDWAKKIIERFSNGQNVPELQLRFAREALGIKNDRQAA